MLVNYATKEIVAKIVYYGPGLCGKTTNLQHIYTRLNPKKRGKMISLATEADRTLFFDFLPVDLGVVQGFRIRFQLYTVPGQVFYGATRRLVLKGADALVFVADSQTDVMGKNVESVEDMKQNLLENGLDPDAIPVVFQYNKRDLANIIDVMLLDRKINYRGAPYFMAEAINGKGVMETFKEITRLLIHDLGKRHSIMDSGIIKELPPEVFEQKPEPKAEGLPDAPEELVIETGYGAAESGEVAAGEMLDQIETISLADTVQAEAFLDNVRKGETAEEARQKALSVSEVRGSFEVEHDEAWETSAAERELTPEELEDAETLAEPFEPTREAMRAGTETEQYLGLDMDSPEMMEPEGVVSAGGAAEAVPPPAAGPKAPLFEDLSPVLGAVEKMAADLRALREESAAADARPDVEEIVSRIEALEKGLRDALEGQDRLMLSILEAVRESKKTNSEAHDKLEDVMKYVADRLRDEQKGSKKRWF